MPYEESVSLTALLSLLHEKHLITTEEVASIRKIGKVVPALIKQGLFTQEEYELRAEDVRQIVGISSALLAGHPSHPTIMKVLESHRKNFPKLIEFLMEELRSKGAPE